MIESVLSDVLDVRDVNYHEALSCFLRAHVSILVLPKTMMKLRR